MAVLALHTSNRELLDSNNDPVFLRAIQITNPPRVKIAGTTSDGSYPEETWFLESDMANMKTQGANCMEITLLYLKRLMPTKNVPDTSYFTTWVDKWVQWAVNHDLYVILDICTFCYNYTYSIPSWIWQGLYTQPTTKAEWDAIIRDFFDTDVTAQDSNRQAYADLWEWIANRYKNYNNVLYSPHNEPFMNVDKVNAETAQHLGVTYSAFMEQIITEIRKESSQIVTVNKPFITSLPNYLNNIQPVAGSNIMWEFHPYIQSGTLLADWKNYDDTNLARMGATFNKPFFVGEYGFIPRNYGKINYPDTWLDIVQEMVDYLEAQTGIVGRQWHEFGDLQGEFWDYMYDYFTQAETDDLLAIILSAGSPPPPPPPSGTFTFGVEEIYGNAQLIDNSVYGQKSTCPYTGAIALSISVPLKYDTTQSTWSVRCGLYKVSDLSLVGETEEKQIQPTASFVWYTFNFPSPPTLENIDYYKVVHADNQSGAIHLPTNFSGDGWEWIRGSYGALPSTLEGSTKAWNFSIYCTGSFAGKGILAQVL